METNISPIFCLFISFIFVVFLSSFPISLYSQELLRYCWLVRETGHQRERLKYGGVIGWKKCTNATFLSIRHR